jgi:hypothetical protein
MEEAVTGWMHGGVGRFELTKSEKHGSGSGDDVATLVVVFSSLGNGVIRPEFRGSLRQTSDDNDSGSSGDATYDVLYVLDPARSWYYQDPGCSWSGFTHFESEISKVIASGGYKHVLMMGDSMGGSGALLFSHLATRVLAFVPQCELEQYPMCTREDFRPGSRQAFSAQLQQSVLASNASISVHLGKDATTMAIHMACLLLLCLCLSRFSFAAVRHDERKNLVNLDATALVIKPLIIQLLSDSIGTPKEDRRGRSRSSRSR